MTKRFGFTLAEVLITLGIIGVVAAMTMPTLINQTNGAQYKAAYKKALSAISQAVTLNVALDDISFADTSNATGGTTTESLLKSRMNVVKTESGAVSGYTTTGVDVTASGNTTLFFNDGSAFSFITNDTACTLDGTSGGSSANTCYGVIDVNGQKGPNKVVICDGKTDYKDGDTNCTVKSPTDIYPVKYYDQTILPATRAAEAVLYGK